MLQTDYLLQGIVFDVPRHAFLAAINAKAMLAVKFYRHVVSDRLRLIYLDLVVVADGTRLQAMHWVGSLD